MAVPPPKNNEDPLDREGVSTISSYTLKNFPLFKFILFCIDEHDLYDFILVKTMDWEGGLKEMEEYRLMGNPDVYGQAYKWSSTTPWEPLHLETPLAHDIKDCYSLACEYQQKGWEVVSD